MLGSGNAQKHKLQIETHLGIGLPKWQSLCLQRFIDLKGLCKSKELKTAGDFTKLLSNRDLSPDAVSLAKMTAKPKVTGDLWNRSVSKGPAEAVIY